MKLIAVSCASLIFAITPLVCLAEEKNAAESECQHWSEAPENNHTETAAEITVPGSKTGVSVEIQSKAEKYIISKTGVDYFEKNYKVLPYKSMTYTFPASPAMGRSDVVFQYLPLGKISKNDEVTVPIFKEKKPATEAPVVDIRDGKIVEPSVTKEEAIQLVEATHPAVPCTATYTVDLNLSQWTGQNFQWTWNVTYSWPLKSGSSSKKMSTFEVDAVTKDVIAGPSVYALF